MGSYDSYGRDGHEFKLFHDIELGIGAEFVGCAELVGKHIHDVKLVQVSKLQRIVSSCCGVEFYFHLYYFSIFQPLPHGVKFLHDVKFLYHVKLRRFQQLPGFINIYDVWWFFRSHELFSFIQQLLDINPNPFVISLSQCINAVKLIERTSVFQYVVCIIFFKLIFEHQPRPLHYLYNQSLQHFVQHCLSVLEYSFSQQRLIQYKFKLYNGNICGYLFVFILGLNN